VLIPTIPCTEMRQESRERWKWSEALHWPIFRLLVMRRQVCK